MYVMHYRYYSGFSSRHLYEMSRREYLDKLIVEKQSVHERYMRISAPEAHAYVRTGYVHSTSLWVDDTGRIRRANPSH